MVTKINQPSAAVIIYNLKDRLGDIKVSSTNEESSKIDETMYIMSDLISVSTQKSKANPAGNFEFKLAPTRNWVTAITPGSWCLILMSNKPITNEVFSSSGIVDNKSFKMMGRIESVRCATGVDGNGTIHSEYIVTGVDWGSIFNSIVYVDPLNRDPNEDNLAMSGRFGYDVYLNNAINNKNKTGKDANPSGAGAHKYQNAYLRGEGKAEVKDAAKISGGLYPTSKENINFLLSLWGARDKNSPLTKKEESIANSTGLTTSPAQAFVIPLDLLRYMNFVDNDGIELESNYIYDLIVQKSGKLIANDEYDDIDQSTAVIEISAILNMHTMWQLLSTNCNGIINELIPEIRFNSDNQPILALYNRVKPFQINKQEDILADTNKVGDGGKVVKLANNEQISIAKDVIGPILSPYKYIKKAIIATEDVIMCNYGTNWRDKINFIEVNYSSSLYKDDYSSAVKSNGQFCDLLSIARDGLQSMIVSTSYTPKFSGHDSPLSTVAYKYALKEWFFNTHKMLNGTLELIGQDQYIQVGDNIMVRTTVLNKNYNFNYKQKSTLTKSYLLAHVESIRHSSSVAADGARHFSTTISFVRGIITDDTGNSFAEDGAVDQDASLTTPTMEKNKESLLTRTKMDTTPTKDI